MTFVKIYLSPPEAFIKYVIMSIGNGNIIVEFFSADIVFKVCERKEKVIVGLNIKN